MTCYSLPDWELVEHKCVFFFFSRFRDFFLVNVLENTSHSVPCLRHAAASVQMEEQRLALLETNKA